MRFVPFMKANGCGNDFLIIEQQHAPADIHTFSRDICDRHSGIGADGVEWITPGVDGSFDVSARLVNSDGSEAEISGNGTRCVAAFVASQRNMKSVRVSTGAGVKDFEMRSAMAPRFE